MLGLFVAACAAYVAVVGLLWVFQRNLLYPATRGRVVIPADLPGFAETIVATPDGERLLAWWKPPASPGRPIVLFLHGNGGSITDRTSRAKALTADGTGMLLLSYRGYASSTGRPSEEGLHTDALAAFDWIATAAPGSRVAVYGESLGSGVAVRLATERPAVGLILDAPYTSTVDVAAGIYWFVPVRALMRDHFASITRIGTLKVP
ncbi:MAG: alpha/beta hydrolase, partial [Alsobacter sp.]